MNRTQSLLVTIILILLLLGNSGCIFASDPPEDGAFLDPIPESTLQAFQFGYKIETKLQAVIAARRALEESSKNYTNVPQVVSVEKLSFARAYSRVEDAVSRVSGTQTGNSRVWLVVFLCEVQLPPVTPEQAPESSQNCTFVIINELDGQSMLLGSSSDCKSLYEWQ
jgi:hypothetical protein